MQNVIAPVVFELIDFVMALVPLAAFHSLRLACGARGDQQHKTRRQAAIPAVK